MLSAPPIQASSAGTAHLRSVPRYKSGCNKWFKTDFVICLSFCFVIYVSFYLGTFSSVFKDCFFELIVVHAFLFHFMYSLTCNFFWSMHLCMHLFMEKCIYSYVFNMFIVVFIHLLNQFIDCFGEWFVFYWCFVFVLYGIHCFMQHTNLCIHLVFFT